MLKLLGRVGKGLATLIGVALGVGGAGVGVALGQGDQLREAVEVIVTTGPALVSALGVVLAAFGVGRKAGAAGGQQ